MHTTPEEKVAAADGTFAYCGRYEIDARQKQIIHLPEVATDPGYVGPRQVRPYVFEGGRLVLSDVEKDDPSVARWKIVWESSIGLAAEPWRSGVLTEEIIGESSTSVIAIYQQLL